MSHRILSWQTCLGIGVGLLLAGAGPARASFHMMQIEQVIGSVNGDFTAQAIQLRMRSPGQNFVSQGKLIAYDANGNNPVTILDLAHNVINGQTGDRVLIATPSFVSATTPTAVPDFFMEELIPLSFLTAGRLTWQSDTGIIYWSLSWGGTLYVGPNTGDTLNDNNGNFGPAFSDPLPAHDIIAIQFNNTETALSTSNSADYLTTFGPVVFVNNARDAFTVTGNTPLAPVASFDAAPLTGPAALLVHFTDSSTGTISSRFWDFGDGGSSSDVNPSHTYTIGGTFTVSLTVIGPGGTNTLPRANLITVTPPLPGPPLQFVSPPVVTNPLLQLGDRFIVAAGIATLFDVGAVDANGDPLAFRWNFGDGTNSTDSAQSGAAHSYNSCGPLTASVTVTAGADSISSNLNLLVACAFAKIKPLPKLNFAKPLSDSITLTATLDLDPAFNPAGLPLTVNVAGVQVAFTFDPKGRDANNHGTARLTFSKATNQGTLTVVLSRGAFQTVLAAHGLTNVTTPKGGVKVTVPVVIVLGNEAFAAAPQLTYTATHGKTGSGK